METAINALEDFDKLLLLLVPLHHAPFLYHRAVIIACHLDDRAECTVRHSPTSFDIEQHPTPNNPKSENPVTEPHR